MKRATRRSRRYFRGLTDLSRSITMGRSPYRIQTVDERIEEVRARIQNLREEYYDPAIWRALEEEFEEIELEATQSDE